MSDIVPTFNMDGYKNGLLTPTVWYAVVQVLWLILSYVDTSDPAGTDDSAMQIAGYEGYFIQMLILFGAWAGIGVAKAGGNAGDGLIAGLILGLIGWILWLILFGFINPVGDPDFADDLLPELWYWLLVHAAGAVTVTGIMGKD